MRVIKINIKKILMSSMVIIMSLVTSLLAEACSLAELPRDKAKALITNTQEFKNISSVDLVAQQLRLEQMIGTISADAVDEPEAAAAEKRKAYYFSTYPIAEIANYYGLVNAQIKRRGTERDGIWSGRPLGFWSFDENYILTEKAKGYWAEYDQPAQETVIPTARKKFISVTGITLQGATDATVEFSYKWEPNILGKSLDPSTQEFRNLPKDMQTHLLEVKGYKNSPYVTSWGDVRPGISRLKKYDDGWRVINVSFL